jgi:hypothetical protein
MSVLNNKPGHCKTTVLPKFYLEKVKTLYSLQFYGKECADAWRPPQINCLLFVWRTSRNISNTDPELSRENGARDYCAL